MSERAYEIMDPDGRAGSGSPAAQLRALHANLISARGWHVQYLLAAADRLDTLEQEKARDGNYHISKEVELRESLAACQRELAEMTAAKDTARFRLANIQCALQRAVITDTIEKMVAQAISDRADLLKDRPKLYACQDALDALKLRAEAAEAERDILRSALEFIEANSGDPVTENAARRSLSPHETS